MNASRIRASSLLSSELSLEQQADESPMSSAPCRPVWKSPRPKRVGRGEFVKGEASKPPGLSPDHQRTGLARCETQEQQCGFHAPHCACKFFDRTVKALDALAMLPYLPKVSQRPRPPRQPRQRCCQQPTDLPVHLAIRRCDCVVDFQSGNAVRAIRGDSPDNSEFFIRRMLDSTVPIFSPSTQTVTIPALTLKPSRMSVPTVATPDTVEFTFFTM